MKLLRLKTLLFVVLSTSAVVIWSNSARLAASSSSSFTVPSTQPSALVRAPAASADAVEGGNGTTLPQHHQQQHHKVCAMTRVKDQPRTLAEWLEYHHVLGVGHTFVVDDCSTDDGRTRSVLAAYQADGLASVYTPEEVARHGCARWEHERVEEEQQRNWAAKFVARWLVGNHAEAEAEAEARRHACEYPCGEGHSPDEGRLFSFLLAQATAPGGAHRCEWLVAFDVDEVMTIQTDLGSSDLASILDAQRLPILRLPWVMMGSGGLEARPPGLMVDNFKAGSYRPWFVKTVARPEFVRDWNFSHWPVLADVSADAAREAYGFEVPPPFASLREYAERNWLAPEENRNITVQQQQQQQHQQWCPAPVSSLFLKHYSYRSFEEFTAHRARALRKSDGGLNAHMLRPREAWLDGSDPEEFDEHPCAHAYGNDFTAAMADRTRASLAARRAQWEGRQQQGGGGGGGAFPPIEEWVI